MLCLLGGTITAAAAAATGLAGMWTAAVGASAFGALQLEGVVVTGRLLGVWVMTAAAAGSGG